MPNNRIKELRLKHKPKLTLVELAKQFNKKGITDKKGIPITLNDSQLSKFERGVQSPRFDEVWQGLAEIFKVTAPYLRGYTNDPIPKRIYNPETGGYDPFEPEIKEIEKFIDETSLEYLKQALDNLQDVEFTMLWLLLDNFSRLSSEDREKLVNFAVSLSDAEFIRKLKEQDPENK